MNRPQSPGSGVREVVVDAEHDGQRVDNFLITQLKGVPRSRIYRILRKGEVRVNKGRVKPEYRLRHGDTVRIPPIRVAEVNAPPKPGAALREQLEQRVLYEDKGLLILNKPSGLAVHGGSGVSFGVIEALRALRPEAPFLELAHRLDRDTSGVLVIAKKRSALRAFQELLREGGEMDKTYLALVQGRWQGGRRRIDAPLRKNQLKSGERMVTVSPDGKPALSLFEPVAIYSQASLMQVLLITGRTHQVRVHAAHTGHPIAGDEKYGNDTFNRAMAERGLKRLFLHAAKLSFTLKTGNGPQRVSVEAPLDPELQHVLDNLERD